MGTAKRKVPRTEGHSALRADVAEFARLLKTLLDPYRPELHYMRGPGPKWHAKHAAGTAEAPGLRGLARSSREAVPMPVLPDVLRETPPALRPVLRLGAEFQ